jgi:hypothetical protein
MSTTLADLIDAISDVIQDSAYTDGILTTRINDAVENIAAGVRMPDGQVSPPLPDLYDMDTVATSTTDPYKVLPSDYQRHVFMVADDSGNQIYPPRGGDYYSFALFLKQSSHKDLDQSGSVSMACVKGSKLYYQDIPSSSEDLTVHFYRVPTAMADDDDEPDGIPAHLQTRLIKHYVCKDIFGDIEDGDNSAGTGMKYHTAKFFEAMTDLIDFIGVEGEPIYYGTFHYSDLGTCD